MARPLGCEVVHVPETAEAEIDQVRSVASEMAGMSGRALQTLLAVIEDGDIDDDELGDIDRDVRPLHLLTGEVLALVEARLSGSMAAVLRSHS